ncbi:hypothetical protein E4T56_gene14393 [Termitomyces sp. T112]|nr:hypothetical protein E4T56_gene14393 [Termitomyces sp. T112]
MKRKRDEPTIDRRKSNPKILIDTSINVAKPKGQKLKVGLYTRKRRSVYMMREVTLHCAPSNVIVVYESVFCLDTFL